MFTNSECIFTFVVFCYFKRRKVKQNVSTHLSETISDFNPIIRGSQVLIHHYFMKPFLTRLKEMYKQRN